MTIVNILIVALVILALLCIIFPDSIGKFFFGTSPSKSHEPISVYKPPLDEEEISRIMEEINEDFRIWSGPGYYHRDIVIVFENDHVRFSAQNSTQTDFHRGWKIYYSKPLNANGVWNDNTSRFRVEMGERTLAMLKRNYPLEARNLYLDGSHIILPTNGK